MEVKIEMVGEVLEYEKYYSKDFFVRFKKDSLGVFEEKIKSKAVGVQDSLKIEWVQRKMRKMPKVVVSENDYMSNVLAFKKRIFVE